MYLIKKKKSFIIIENTHEAWETTTRYFDDVLIEISEFYRTSCSFLSDIAKEAKKNIMLLDII